MHALCSMHVCVHYLADGFIGYFELGVCFFLHLHLHFGVLCTYTYVNI